MKGGDAPSRREVMEEFLDRVWVDVLAATGDTDADGVGAVVARPPAHAGFREREAPAATLCDVRFKWLASHKTTERLRP